MKSSEEKDSIQLGLVIGFIVVLLFQSFIFMLCTSGLGFTGIIGPMAVSILAAFLLSKVEQGVIELTEEEEV